MERVYRLRRNESVGRTDERRGRGSLGFKVRANSRNREQAQPALVESNENRAVFAENFFRKCKGKSLDRSTMLGYNIKGKFSKGNCLYSLKKIPGQERELRMAKNLEISILLDYYGQMLTEKQLEVAQFYYNEDLSLAEIAQFANITRQGVRDSLKRAEATLLEMEERMGLAKKFRVYQQALEEITACAKEISFEAQRYPNAYKIQKNAEKIAQLAQKIEE